ncbi:hypothetical protein ACIBU0_32905 [Streptomyces sp. NPDC049627]|uniref:hypothetical protein n=1 Tax=Streptomyces sp. NPDC049627 TaxID=3365595 RepID=UPI0037AE85C8
MPHGVLALGLALVAVAGSVWYVPALADLRAGADRPDSRRSAAAACLSGWGTVAGSAVLLFLTDTWWLPCAAVGAGAALAGVFRIRAAVRRRSEARESARHRAELGQAAPRRGQHRARTVFVALVGTGLAAATLAALAVTTGPGARRDWATVVLPVVVTGLFLAMAIGWASAGRSGVEDRRRMRRQNP